MFDTEAKFYDWLRNKVHLVYTRIESHGTGNGIPDIYATGNKHDVWIELKNDKTLQKKNNVRVQWRPGQQAWMVNYSYAMHNRCCITLVSCKDSILLVRNVLHYSNNKVDVRQGTALWVPKEKLTAQLLLDMSDLCIMPQQGVTVEEYIYSFLHQFDLAIAYNTLQQIKQAYEEQTQTELDLNLSSTCDLTVQLLLDTYLRFLIYLL